MRSDVSTARWAATIAFGVYGVALTQWFTVIPATKDRLTLSDGALGIALLGLPLGAILAFGASGRAIARIGSPRVVRLAGPALSLTLIGPVLAPSPHLLFAALVVAGVANGTLDVAINSQGVAIENRSPHPVFIGMHAAFSFGSFLGAGIAIAAGAFEVTPFWQLSIVGLIAAGALTATSRSMLDAAEELGGHVSFFAVPPRGLRLTGMIAAVTLLVEGAMADWSGIYLTDELDTNTDQSAVGFAAFSIAMALGRLTGDRVVARYGTRRTARTAAATAAATVTVAVAGGTAIVFVAAITVTGLSLSVLFPLAASQAGFASDHDRAQAIAGITAFGYTGFLIGPAFVGMLSELAGLPAAFLTIAALLLIAAAASRSAITDTTRPPHEPATEHTPQNTSTSNRHTDRNHL